ncbi:hypothetical protein DFH09DRAFT_1127217 [Mycena vulgaris]|nr:hypothetical protein DFH09DRAFT_1127217 [Mycena vulgaris]
MLLALYLCSVLALLKMSNTFRVTVENIPEIPQVNAAPPLPLNGPVLEPWSGNDEHQHDTVHHSAFQLHSPTVTSSSASHTINLHGPESLELASHSSGQDVSDSNGSSSSPSSHNPRTVMKYLLAPKMGWNI